MATTLLDALQNGLTNPLGAPNAGFGGAPAPTQSGAQATQQLGDLLRAKTGRAVSFGSGSTPRMSSVAADSAASQAAAQLAQTKQSGLAQAQQIGVAADQQKDRANLEQQQAQLATLDQRRKFADKTSELIQSYKQAGRQLDLDKDKAAAEQLGFLTRLSDDKYVTKLQQVGELQRLDQANNFQQATLDAVFGAEMDALKGRLSNDDLLNQDENAFREKIGQMDLDFATSLASSKASAANTQALYTGAGNLAGAGINAYGDYKQGAFDEDYQKWKSGEDKTGYGHYKAGVADDSITPPSQLPGGK